MANRAQNLDDKVFSIDDLKNEGSKKLAKPYRDFYNEGAMDSVTSVFLRVRFSSADNLQTARQ
ncbi:hypothetical protein LTS08_008315 [Lithohypha guttulata]|nr:hypothetical protein LTS08_008315 [Lithohypha guttulata]